MQVMEAIAETGMVPVFYHADAEIAKQVVKACKKVEPDLVIQA